MPKQVSQAEYDALLNIIREFPEGALTEEVFEAMPEKLSRRTLLRRLNVLLGEGRLQRFGKGRATRYSIPVTAEFFDAFGSTSTPEGGELYIPLSPKGAEIKQLVRVPIHKRNPVGFNQDFLGQYRPNHSFYLSAAVRQRLFELGQSMGEELPAGTYARQIWNRLLIDLSWNSSRLEGNTYSLLETERLLERGEAVAGKDAAETQMILNHKAAIELLVDQAEDIGFNRYTILNLHALLADNLLPDPQAVGRLRQIPVNIGGTVYHPLEVPQLIEGCFDQILHTAALIDDPFEQAFFVTVHIPYLQAFEDVNKRVSRLAANIPLIRHNLSPLSFVDVPAQAYIDGLLGVYEQNRVELLRDVFVWAYERSCARYAAVRQSLGEPDQFRLRHRALIGETVKATVAQRMDKLQATAYIRSIANEALEAATRLRFVEVVETELMSLHEGNMARYRIRPSEYADWQKNWK